MRKIRIAQIGTSINSHGEAIRKSLCKQNDLFEFVGYALPENEREKFPVQAAKFEGLREMTVEEILNDPTIEAVAVETEEKYLTKYATMVARAGKHMHMEKPGSASLADFEQLIETVRANKLVFHTGYMYRYNPEVMALMDEIRRGELGEIVCVEAQMNCYHNVEIRRWLEGYEGGMMFFLGCHLVDLILQIQGEPKQIIPMNRRTGIDGTNAVDFGMALFDYGDRVSFAKTIDVEVGGYARRQLVVVGTKKTVELKPLERSAGAGTGLQFTGATEYAELDWHDHGTYHQSEIHNRYDAMMASFAAMVRGEKKNPWDYDYELMLYKTVLKACGIQ